MAISSYYGRQSANRHNRLVKRPMQTARCHIRKGVGKGAKRQRKIRAPRRLAEKPPSRQRLPREGRCLKKGVARHAPAAHRARGCSSRGRGSTECERARPLNDGQPVANAYINPIVVQSLPATVGRTVVAMEGVVAFAATLRNADHQPFQTFAD